MIDGYTKAVLTVIAAALTAIAAQGLVGKARAQLTSCGENAVSPCYIATGISPLEMRVIR